MAAIFEVLQKGSFDATIAILKAIGSPKTYRSDLETFGQRGVYALEEATPVKTGETASSWGYEIKETSNSITIEWTNDHMIGSVPLAVLIQYGHGTNHGGYVQGRDFINPALQPIFDEIAQAISDVVNRQ